MPTGEEPRKEKKASEIEELAVSFAREIAAKVGTKPTTAARTSLVRLPTGPVGWDCTGSEFTCGEYTCSGTVGCSDVFKCTVKFTGLAFKANVPE